MSDLKLYPGSKIVINPSYEWHEDARSLGISHHELEVFTLRCEGHDNKEVGAILGIKYQSVKNHWHSLSKKIGANNLGQALAMLMFKNVLRMENRLANNQVFQLNHDNFVKATRELLSDESNRLDKKSKKAARQFLIEKGLYGQLFEDRAKELKNE